MKTQLKKLYQLFSRSDKIKFGILAISIFISGLMNLVSIGVIPAFLGTIIFPDKVLDYAVIGPILKDLDIVTPDRLLVFGCLVILIVFCMKSALQIFNAFLEARFTTNRMAEMRKRLFSAYMSAPYNFFLRRNTAELLRNVNVECNKVGNTVLKPMVQVIKNSMLLVLILIMLMVVQPVATLVMLVILCAAGLTFILKLQFRIKEYGQKAMEERQISNKCVHQGMGGIKEARVLGGEKTFVDSFFKSAQRAAQCMRFQQIVQKMGAPILETVGVFAMEVIIVILILGYGTGIKEAIPVLALFAISLSRLRGIINAIITNFTNLRYNLVSVEPVYDDLWLLKKKETTEKIVPPSKVKTLPLEDKIELKDLTFHYEKTKVPAVENVSLSIKQGTSVAFVGPTGAGKTTIVDLILGLLRPTEGEITVDGTNIHSKLRSWQKNIGYIPQFIYLLDDSVKNNIALGIPEEEIEYERLRDAISAAQLDDMIGQLPHGVETVVGEHGIRLSGGQRQRVGIARALYHNPDVLVMDEATSNLDSGTEKAIVESVNRLKGDRTIIMIAHRITTVKNCDCIYFMKDGYLDDQGTYTELYQNHPEFKVMAQ